MAIYNLTNVTDANNTYAVFSSINDVSGDWLARLFLIGVFLLITVPIMIRTAEVLKAMVAGAFVTTILSILFYGINLTGYKEPLISLLALGVLTVSLLLGGFE